MVADSIQVIAKKMAPVQLRETANAQVEISDSESRVKKQAVGEE